MTTGTGGSWPGGAAAKGGLPERIGHYKITDRIGRGAMGVVYSGRDERTGRPVALKVMMTDLEGDKETRERFNREANVAGKMVHRNIINVYEAGEEDGRLYMVMELLEGETLNDYMKRVGNLPLEHALDLMMQVCEGLAIAHAHAIVHRDIKPGNLFVMRDGGLKILDFGVARLANSSMTASGFIVGTPDFMSPEQARGREIDQRSDVFSAGAVFYYMLSGVKPFSAPDLPAVLHRVNSENPPQLTPEQCPPGLWRILMKALAKQTSDRYADMGAAAGRSGAVRAGLRQRDARHGERDPAACRRGQRAGGPAQPVVGASRAVRTRQCIALQRPAARPLSGARRARRRRAGRRAVPSRGARRDQRRSRRPSGGAQRRDHPGEAVGGHDVSRRLVLDDGRSQRELVVRERMTVGRDPGCDISDGDPRLSRRHAEFLAGASGLVVRDLDSRNGVRVNGRLVREATLSPGDLVEIAHLAVRFLDDSPEEPAGVALPPANPVPVEGVQVRDGFEDDRTRVLPAPKLSAVVSGPIVVDRETLAAVRDAGDVAISALEGTVRVARPHNVAQARSVLPKPRLGVQDLMTTGWGWRVLGQGVLLAGVVFLMVTIPMLHWLTSISGPIGNMLLLRMLTAPLLASLFLGLIVASLIARTTARGLERDDHT